MIFKSEDGKVIFCESFSVKEPRGSVLMIHGLSEHSGRYSGLVHYFNANKFDVHTFDLRGHGRSPGTRGHFTTLEEIYSDIDGLFSHLSANGLLNSEVPLFLFGHSLGGLVAFHYSFRYSQMALYPKLAGLILSAPAFSLRLSLFQEVQGVISQSLPSFLSSLQIATSFEPSFLTRDLNEQRKFIEDPLNHRWVTPATFGAVQKGIEEVRDQLDELKLSTLVILGGKDPIVNTDEISSMLQKAKTRRGIPIEVKIFHSFRHEPFNEKNKKRAYWELGKWLKQVFRDKKKPAKVAVRIKSTSKKPATKKSKKLSSLSRERHLN